MTATPQPSKRADAKLDSWRREKLAEQAAAEAKRTAELAAAEAAAEAEASAPRPNWR